MAASSGRYGKGKAMARRTWIALLAILAISSSVPGAHIIKYHDGGQEQYDELTYDSDSLYTGEGEAIAREGIKEIFFDTGTPARAASAEAEAIEVPRDIQAILLQAREETRKYPDADGIVLLDDGEYVLNADGTNLYRYHFQGLILKEEKKGQWGAHTHRYDDKRERMRVLWARTIKPTGEVVDLDLATVTISDPPARGGSFFGKGKILAYTLPELDVGCIVEYLYEREEYDPFDPEMFFPTYYFQGYEPLRLSRMVVTIPSTRKLNYKAYRMPPGTEEPSLSHTDTTSTYVWVADDMPPLIPEPAMPPYRSIVPRVQASLFETWDHIFDWMAQMQERRIQVTPEIEAAVAELTAGAADTEEKIARIYHFIQQNIRYISIKGSIGSGWSGHPAFVTLKNKYGDCIDKSVLFTTMLKVIGVTSEPVVLLTNGAGDEDRVIPTMAGNHAICLIHLDGREFYLDATSTSHRYPSFRGDDHGVTTINALRREIGFIPVPEPEANQRIYELDVRILPAGNAEVEYASHYNGDYEAGPRGFYMYRQKSDYERALANMISSISPNAVLKDYELQNIHNLAEPFRIRLSYTLNDYVVNAGDLRIFSVPGLETSFREVSLPQRYFDISYNTSFEMVHEVTIAVPQDYRVKYLPEEVSLETPYATYTASYAAVDDTTIVFRDDFRRIQRLVPVHDYQEYKAFLQKVSKYTQEQLFFEIRD